MGQIRRNFGSVLIPMDFLDFLDSTMRYYELLGVTVNYQELSGTTRDSHELPGISTTHCEVLRIRRNWNY